MLQSELEKGYFTVKKQHDQNLIGKDRIYAKMCIIITKKNRVHGF